MATNICSIKRAARETLQSCAGVCRFQPLSSVAHLRFAHGLLEGQKYVKQCSFRLLCIILSAVGVQVSLNAFLHCKATQLHLRCLSLQWLPLHCSTWLFCGCLESSDKGFWLLVSLPLSMLGRSLCKEKAHLLETVRCTCSYILRDLPVPTVSTFGSMTCRSP